MIQNNINQTMKQMVKRFKNRENTDIQKIIQQIVKLDNLTHQCIMMKEYLSPQSTFIQSWVSFIYS